MLAGVEQIDNNGLMTKLSAEDFIQWTNPNPYSLTGFATSEQELEEVAAFITQERQAYLLESFQDRIAELKGELPPAEKPLDLEDIPLKPVLSYHQHKELVAHSETLNRWGWHSQMEQYRMWRILAEFEAVRGGFRPTASKYANTTYQNEETFQKFLADSKALTDTGFPVRNLIDGVRYVYQGALDLNTVQHWLGTRDSHDYPPVYHTPRGYWPIVLAAKQIADDEKGFETFADVANEITPGVFVAPYLPEEVVASEDYFSSDDVTRELARAGAGVNLANRVMYSMLHETTTNQDALNYMARLTNSYSTYLSNSSPTYAVSGVLFIKTAIIPEISDAIATSDHEGKKIRHLAQGVLARLSPDTLLTQEEDWYERAVFGT